MSQVLNPFVPEFTPSLPASIVSPVQLRGSYQDEVTKEWVPYLVGKLRSFSAENGFGFIECPDALERFGADVFVHKNEVPSPWRIGQVVEFAVKTNARGQPQARDVLWLADVQAHSS